MGSKAGLSAIVGVMDVAYLLEAFEQLNCVTLSLCMELTRTTHRPDLRLTMTARTPAPAGAEGALLASSRVTLLREGYKDLEAAITFSLYKIDGELARREMSKATQIA